MGMLQFLACVKTKTATSQPHEDEPTVYCKPAQQLGIPLRRHTRISFTIHFNPFVAFILNVVNNIGFHVYRLS